MLKTISSIVNAIGALNYKGTWDASTNTPTLASGVGTKGDYYVVSVAGSTNLDGETLWGVGDWAVFNGSIWQKVDGGSTGNFTSVNTGTLDVTGNTTLGDASTDTVRVNGYMGIGAPANAPMGLFVRPTALTGTTQYGASFQPNATSGATNAVIGVDLFPIIPDAAITVPEVNALEARQGSKGASATVTTWTGLKIRDIANGATNYGVWSLVSSGANKYNIYASGTAQNYFAGNVGIGTTSPFGKLDVNGITGAGSNSFLVGFGINGDNYYTSGSSGIHVFRAASTERMRVDASGNLGLGVTPSAWAVGRVLQIANVTGTFLYGAGGQSILGTNSYYDTSWKYAGTGNATYYEQTGGSHNWFTAPSGTAGNAITFTQAMTLDASGRLAIGETSAQGYRLNVKIANTSTTLLDGDALRLASSGADADVHLVFTDSVSKNAFIGMVSGNLYFYTNLAERMRLDTSGNLGIGTNAPANRLDIVNSASSAQMSIAGSDGQFAGMFGGTGSNGPGIFFLNTAPALRFGTATTKALGSFAELMRLTAGGSLGLGVTPSAWLAASKVIQVGAGASISSRSNTIVEVTSNAFLNTSGSWTYQNTGEATLYAGAGGLHRWSIAPSGTAGNAITFTTAMTLDASGNLGIGNSNPQQRLHVTGNGLFDGAVQGNIIIQKTGTNGFSLFSSAAGTLGFYDANASAERMRLDSSGNLGIGTSSPVNKLQVAGSFGRGAPVTKTGNFTLADTENWIICNGTGTITVTLPAASSWTGREFTIKTIAAFTVISNASNVVPLAGGAAGTAILAATAGTWATLVSDGTNWIIMQA